MKTFYFSLFFLIISSFIQAQEVYTYDFNNLEMGDLDGQDDWHTILHVSGPHDFVVDYTGGGDACPDGTLGIWYTGSGGGYGRTATRKATDNFDFDFTQADIVEFEVDVRRNWWGMFCGIGFDADGDGHIAPGLASEENDGGIYFNMAGYNPEVNNRITLPDETVITFAVENSGWGRYKMVLDFNANDGAGAVALFYDSGITGDWVAIPEVQGVNMGLTPGSGDKRDRTVWDGVFLNATGGTAGYDNILIRQTGSEGEAQYISFPAVNDKLTTDEAFELNAEATSGLPIEYEILSGPATLDGSTVTLTGEPGIVSISANQAGDDTYAPAAQVSQSFEVVDATAYTADLTIRRPIEGPKVYMSELSEMLIVASAYIEHTEVLSIESVSYQIEGSKGMMTEKVWGTGYYSSTWTPSDYGTYTMTITANSTGGMSSVSTVTFEITDDISDLNVQTFDHEHISTSTSTSVIKDFEFPSFVGSFDQIMAYLNVTCPAGGCDAWDRVGQMYAKSPTGEWIEIIRYITPYGVECDHQIDVTDYSSIFQGLVELRFSIGTDAHGFEVSVDFDFSEGEPPYKYSWVNTFWDETYPFGDYANLQPVEPIIWNFEDITEAAKLKVFNTGHGWGASNSQNAAEFYEATHHIYVNDDSFEQHLWVVCNPNPDGCQPQNGTWYYNRAGWCPGSIGHMYEYDLTPYVDLSDVDINYEFYPGYVDYCHPNHPDCVSGQTCNDCNAGFNPHYIVSANLVSYSNYLFIPTGQEELDYFGMQLYPNPSRYMVQLSTSKPNKSINAEVGIYSLNGQKIDAYIWDGSTLNMNISHLAEGVYLVAVKTGNYTQVKRLIVE